MSEFEYHGNRQEFWVDYVERTGWFFDSQNEYNSFLAEEDYLGGLFNIWANPNADDLEQHAAYGEFWEILWSEYGLDKDSFDWHNFKEKYGASH